MKLYDFGFDILKMSKNDLKTTLNNVKDRLQIHTNEEIKQFFIQNPHRISLEIVLKLR